MTDLEQRVAWLERQYADLFRKYEDQRLRIEKLTGQATAARTSGVSST
jgi:hypothetical protein